MQTLWLTQVPPRGWMAFLSFPCTAHPLIQRHRHLLIELGAIAAGMPHTAIQLNATQLATAGFLLPVTVSPPHCCWWEVWAFCMGSCCITGEHLTASVYQAPSWQPRTSTHGGEHAPSDNDIPTGNSCDCLNTGSQCVIDGSLCGNFHLIPQRTRGLVSQLPPPTQEREPPWKMLLKWLQGKS